MKDALIAEHCQRMLMDKTGTERIQLANSMLTVAKAWAMASLKEQHPEASEAELRGLLFLRLYASDFSPQDRQRIFQHIVTKDERHREAHHTP